jgi:hypothetical protein
MLPIPLAEPIFLGKRKGFLPSHIQVPGTQIDCPQIHGKA